MEPRPPPKIPKDGPGPRGLPDCYYTSRVLNSTFRYVKFVKKLRATEEEQRKGQLNTLKELKDKQTSDFFIRCDRRSLINNVKRRVDLCLASYEDDLQRKRNRLLDLFKKEEERDIRMFVEQAQAGREAIWQDKFDRLQYLLQKRKKEHEEKYKDTPLSKSPHVTACIHKLRAKEAQEIQLYQMKEKQARREAEHELDKMWHEVAMRESEALAARMEQDAIDRYRRDMECKQYTDMQLQERRLQRERDRDILKQEQLMMKQKFEEDSRKEAEAERLRVEKRHETGRERKEMIEERKQTLAKQEAQDQLINKTWDSLAGQGLADEKAKLALRRRKEMELDVCNKKMIALREQLKSIELEDEVLVQREAKRLQDVTDKKRCDYLIWSQKTNADVRKAMVDQIKERQAAREQLKKKLDEQNEYYHQLQDQLQALVDHRAMEDLRARKTHQQNLLDQIEYNKLLKDRAKQEELEQIKKCELATEEYQQEVNRMLCRPFFSDELHPFMKQMAKGLNMREKCPCSKPDYCK